MKVASQEMEIYFKKLESQINEIYEIAEKARSLGLDPELEPQIPRAEDLASRVENLTGPKGVAIVIHELERKMSREELALKVAEMIVDGRFGKFPEQQAAELAIKAALAIITEGIVAAPLEGITDVKIRKNFDGSPYLALYFAGPIRSAGGTAAALAVLAGDFVRRKLYLSPYKPTDQEVERFVEEVDIYGTSVAHLQYTPSEDEVRTAVQNIPVEITGEPTERDITVTAYRDLGRIGHNFIRGGAILALAEGVLQKAHKIMRHVDELNIDGWGWLSELIARAPIKEAVAPVYLDEVIAGRPVFSHPKSEGGFRLRYGRSRNTGIAAIGVHPAAMVICDDFMAIGVQLKTELPGKSGVVTPADSIEGPLVKLDDGSVVQLNSVGRALELRNRVSEILSLGDLLVGFGEFLENNHPLVPAGYCEEWWAQEVERASEGKKFDFDISPCIFPPYVRPAPTSALEISEKLGVPLHPAYTYCFHDISIEEFRELGNWLVGGELEFEGDRVKGLRVVSDPGPKRVLEILGVPHVVEDGWVLIEQHALPLCKCMGLLNGRRLTSERLQSTLRENSTKDVLELVQTLAGFPVRQRAPTRIGCRMGRPEKANPRMMNPPVHLLFPVGLRGGPQRSVIKAAESGEIYVEVAKMECPECGAISFTRKCPKCGAVTNYVRACSRCGRPTGEERCLACNVRTEYFSEQMIELRKLLDEGLRRLKEEMLEELKGVRGMTSTYKIPEPLEKGILRAKHNVYVFKDGTIRFDATNAPLTHFKPKEIGVRVERLRELGYNRDVSGQPLEREDQFLELKVQDIILSKVCAEYLFRASKFVDELLQKFYGLQHYYNLSRPEDLVGHLVVGLAPHTSVGIAGRVVGFTDANVGCAHPFFHAAKRRDCDGDEDCVMLLLDALLNFSKRFLPSTRGGMMDAPLVLNIRIDPREIDEEAHHMDLMERYPLEFYESTLRLANPNELLGLMETVERKLMTEAQYEGLGYSFDTENVAAGPHTSRYKTLETMKEKISAQLELARKIKAVNERDVAERLIEHHFIPDLKGNMRAFASQQFRCTSCNSKYRRVPLSGECLRCGGKLVLTMTRGGVEKYLQVAMRVAHEYGVSDYTKQRLKLAQRDIKSIFESDAHRQLSLADFL